MEVSFTRVNGRPVPTRWAPVPLRALGPVGSLTTVWAKCEVLVNVTARSRHGAKARRVVKLPVAVQPQGWQKKRQNEC